MRKTILFVCEGRQHFAIAKSLAITLAAEGRRCALYYPHPYTLGPEFSVFCNVINEELALPGYLQKVGLVFFFTHETSPFCLRSILIGFIAKKTKTSCLTLQHGWIQPGLNFHSELQRVSYDGRDSDSSASLHHFSKVLRFFGDNGIGYPLYSGSSHVDQREVPSNAKVLIATNFNWGIYSRENIVAFIRAVGAIREYFPSYQLVHRAHSAENSQGISGEIGFYLEDIGVEGGAWSSIDEALAWSDLVITTPSTVALDAIARGRHPLIFCPPAFAESLENFRGNIFFRSADLLLLLKGLAENKVTPRNTIKEFDSKLFIKYVDEAIAESGDYCLDEEMYLEYLRYSKI